MLSGDVAQYTVDMKNKQGGSGTVFTDTDNSWGTGLLSNRQTIGVDAQYGAAMTWDYYKNVHQREGIANDQGRLKPRPLPPEL